MSCLVQVRESNIRSMISGFLQTIHSRWLALLQVHLIFNLLGVVILGPLFGLLLQTVVGFSGNAAAVDQDIARLLLTPVPGALKIQAAIGSSNNPRQCFLHR